MTPEVNDAVRNALMALVNDEGLLTAEAVKAAWQADPTGLLAPFFTADANEAANLRWLEEARTLIRKVELQYDDAWLKGPVPAFVSLMPDRQREGGGYRPTTQVLSNQRLRAELLATAKKELEAWARRHKMLRGFVLQVMQAGGIPAGGILSEAELAAAAQEGGEAA